MLVGPCVSDDQDEEYPECYAKMVDHIEDSPGRSTFAGRTVDAEDVQQDDND